MSTGNLERRYSLIGGPEPETLREFGEAVRAGLSQRPKSLPCRYLYDARGSELFDEICLLPEYYPTRTEAGILEHIAAEVLGAFDSAPVLVELGSGSALKTRHLIDAIIDRHGAARFEPIDVSRSALEESAQALLGDYPNLEVHGVAADYVAGLRMLDGRSGQGRPPRWIVWLGSSIGNFRRDEAASFLSNVREGMSGADRLMVGFDLRKDTRTLEAAYDDAAGVTARFIRNLLSRINRELGGHFVATEFGYTARYDADEGRVEMFLESPTARTVEITELGMTAQFEAGERIHMENSYKYSTDEIAALACEAGLELLGTWTDPQSLFCEALMGASC